MTATPIAARFIEDPPRSMGSHQSARMVSDTWLTPPGIVRALGEFDLDPCCPSVMPWQTAREHYSSDGLDRPWRGRVWLNPPYGVNLGNHGGALDGRANHVLVKAGYDAYDDTEENLITVVVPAIKACLAACSRAIVFCAAHNAWHFPRADYIGGVYLPAAQGRNKWGFGSLSHCLMYGAAPDLHLGARATAISSTEAVERNGHPCPKPLSWMRWAVSLASRFGETIYDPFMGSGTTGMAAHHLGRQFIGIEIHEPYFDIACRRIEEAQRQGDLLRDVLPKAEQRGLGL